MVVDVVVTVTVVIVVVVVVLVFVVAAAAAAVLLLSSWALLQLPCVHRGLKQREQTKHCEKGFLWISVAALLAVQLTKAMILILLIPQAKTLFLF